MRGHVDADLDREGGLEPGIESLFMGGEFGEVYSLRHILMEMMGWLGFWVLSKNRREFVGMEVGEEIFIEIFFFFN